MVGWWRRPPRTAEVDRKTKIGLLQERPLIKVKQVSEVSRSDELEVDRVLILWM